MALAKNAYAMSANLPKGEVYGLIAQIRRAAVSVPSNIAEGHGRLTDLQFRHFLGNARGSLYELETQFELATGFGYVDQHSADDLRRQTDEVGRLINGLMTSLRTDAGSANFAGSANQRLH